MIADQHAVTSHSSKLSLRQLMIIFLLAIVSVVILINGWLIWNSWQRTITSAQDDAHNLSQSLSRQAEDSFLQVDLTLQDVSDRISLIGLNQEQHGYLRELLSSRTDSLPQLNGMAIYDAQGNWLVTSKGNIPRQINNSDREYFRYHQTHNDARVHIGKVIRSRATGDLVIPVSLRLNNSDGSFRGILLASVNLSFFKTVYGYYNLGRHNVLALMLSDGTILYLRPYVESAINRNISDSPLFTTLLKNASSGTAVYKSALDGKERVFGYSALQRYSLVTVAGYDKRQLMRGWFSTLSVYIALCTILLLVIFLLGMLVLRHISLNLKNQQELAAVRDRLTAMNRTLQTLALVDGLTGLANRRQFDLYLQHSIDRANKLQVPLALLMIDVDAFKAFNDTYGHPAGDDCLRKIADALAHLPHRPDNLVARYGGEEFAIILPGCDRDMAYRFAQQALEAITALNIPHQHNSGGQQAVSVSVGLHVMTQENQALSPQALIAGADRALYAAKNAGKNRVAENN